MNRCCCTIDLRWTCDALSSHSCLSVCLSVCFLMRSYIDDDLSFLSICKHLTVHCVYMCFIFERLRDKNVGRRHYCMMLMMTSFKLPSTPVYSCVYTCVVLCTPVCCLVYTCVLSCVHLCIVLCTPVYCPVYTSVLSCVHLCIICTHLVYTSGLLGLSSLIGG